MRGDYEQWLRRQQYQDNTIVAQLHRVGRVEHEYGDLDKHYAADELESVIAALVYTTEDERQRKPNPSRIRFEGDPRKNLASYKNAVVLYRRFLDERENRPVHSRRWGPVPSQPRTIRLHKNTERQGNGSGERSLDNLERLARMKRLLAAGLDSFVSSRLTQHYGSSWRQHARLPDRLPPSAPLDAHALLYALLNNWHEVFRHVLPAQARASISTALDGRNAEAHASQDIDPHRALRALSASADLLAVVGAAREAGEMTALRDALIRELAMAVNPTDTRHLT